MHDERAEPPTEEELKDMSQEELVELIRRRVAQEEAESPVQEPVPVRRLVGCGAAVLLAVAFGICIMLRSFGLLIMGVSGIVGTYALAVLFALVIAWVARPVAGAVMDVRQPVKRALAAIGILGCLAWRFVLCPILDIPRLASPAVVELRDVEVYSDPGEFGVDYRLKGEDASGARFVFTVDEGFHDAWDPADDDATVTYLPYSRTVLAVE
ncbi:hypothetical protein [Enorma burkinafasonensis]|uniref:hypothetical protein n=1 Tax=Enorma burkinafasonensis TaxID=2590867 RepID=UPI0011A8D60D|nr:hypothetical protein [Enorma burkinafasonensis]